MQKPTINQLFTLTLAGLAFSFTAQSVAAGLQLQQVEQQLADPHANRAARATTGSTAVLAYSPQHYCQSQQHFKSATRRIWPYDAAAEKPADRIGG